jgi:hypothetical protein
MLDIRNENGFDSLLIWNIEMAGGGPLALNIRMRLTSHIIYETQYSLVVLMSFNSMLLLLRFRNSDFLWIDFQLLLVFMKMWLSMVFQLHIAVISLYLAKVP